MKYNYNDIFGIKRRIKSSLILAPFLFVIGAIIYAYENWAELLQTLNNFFK